MVHHSHYPTLNALPSRTSDVVAWDWAGLLAGESSSWNFNTGVIRPQKYLVDTLPQSVRLYINDYVPYSDVFKLPTCREKLDLLPSMGPYTTIRNGISRY